MTDDDGFIGLPRGMAPINPDSGTVRRERPERPRTEREEIVFFPAAPGVPPVVEPVEPVVEPVETPTTEPYARAELDEATRASLPRRHAAAVWRIYVAGRAVPIDGWLYLGRNPEATAEHPDAPVLAVDDPRKSVSKTHALLEVDGETLWVHDLESTNGVWVIPSGGEPIEVVPGARTAIPAGAVLELGELALDIQHE